MPIDWENIEVEIEKNDTNEFEKIFNDITKARENYMNKLKNIL